MTTTVKSVCVNCDKLFEEHRIEPVFAGSARLCPDDSRHAYSDIVFEGVEPMVFEKQGGI